MTRAEEIIKYAKEIRYYISKNPYKVAEYFGFKINFRIINPSIFKAHTIRIPNYPTVISINEAYAPVSKMILCAHELGHALLHEGVNNFDPAQRSVRTDKEYEANLFAVALLFNEDDFNTKFKDMSNTSLLSIIETNLKVL